MSIKRSPHFTDVMPMEIHTFRNYGSKGTSERTRTSSLQEPIMVLTDHEGEIFCGNFHPDGSFLAAAGFDSDIYFYYVYEDGDSFLTLGGHTGIILDLKFSADGRSLYTASTDKTLSIWDTEVGMCEIELRGHTSYVNSCSSSRTGSQLICSASNDCTIKVWNAKENAALQSLKDHQQVTSVTFNDCDDLIISGGTEGVIKIWDMRRDNEILHEMFGHSDKITGLALSPDGSYLLSNSIDNTLRIWDMRPGVQHERCVKVLQGHQHIFEKHLLKCGWSPDGTKVTAGSADKYIYIWDRDSGDILYKIPGHNGCVNEVNFHPKEPIIMSCSSDKQIFLGEI